MATLVLGATGFIGPRLIRKLVAYGETVVGMDLNPGVAAFADVPVGAPVVRGDITQFADRIVLMNAGVASFCAVSAFEVPYGESP